jgi:hypothetical protein
VKNRHIQGYSPRLCRLRTDGLAPREQVLNVLITCWRYGPSKSMYPIHQQMLGLSALLQWLCWERNWDRSRRPHSRAERGSREHFFSGAVHPSNSVDSVPKVAMYGDCPQEAYEWHMWTGVESVRVVCIRFSLQGVHRFESLRLSNMSNRLFVAVFT